MVSTVTAKLKPGAGVEAIVRALFPCGSVTGAPKIRAMEVIADLEQSPRGVYCGAVGVFSPDGSARFNVAIRTLTISGSRGELGIGGAVVQDSDADGEYAECLLKARYMETSRRPLELIETLKYSPAGGFARLELHLDRMKRSAAALGLKFAAQRARKAVDSSFPLPLRERQKNSQAERADFSVRGSADALRVRLTLNEMGVFACTSAPLADDEAQWTYAISPQRTLTTDALARHKTNWRDLYDREFARLTKSLGCNEVIFLNERGEVAEGSRTNVFVARGGTLLTPPLSAGALDGVLRRALIGEGRCIEATLLFENLVNAEVYLGNSLRGLMRANPTR